MNNPTDNKRIATTTVGIICLTIAVVLCCVATFAWFDNSVGSLDFPKDFGGSSMAAYFAGGEGSSTEPYIIESSLNLYNLAWLQYLGYFNMRSGLNNGRAQTYFKLSDNLPNKILDMKDVPALPPIGTSEHPFIGHFDGNDKTVINLTVSNKQSDFNGVYPTNAKFDNSGMLTTCADADGETPSQIEFVAMFGVMGDFDRWVANSSEYAPGNNNGIEIKDPRDDPKNMSEITGKIDEKYMYYGAMYVGNMYVDNLVVKSYTSNTLVGLAAGYVAGSLKNFGVYRSTINLAGGAMGTTRVLDANGNSVSYGSTVSKFSIVGDYDTTLVGWSEKPSESSGDDSDFGGSVDMRTLNRRIDYITAKVGAFSSSWLLTAIDDNFGIGIKHGSSTTEFYWNPQNLSSNQNVYLNDGTFLPLNVNKEKMGIDSFEVADGEEHTVNIKGSGSVTYHINSEYATMSSEIMKLTNTGYIVGKGEAGKNGDIRSRIQPIASGSNGGIYKSLGFSSTQGSAVYDKSSFEMLTIGTNGKTYRILDDVKTSTTTALSDYIDGSVRFDASPLNFKEYKVVRNNFDSSMKDVKVVHGFHFMQSLPYSSTIGKNLVDEANASKSIVSRNEVLIDKTYYTTGNVPNEYSKCHHVNAEYQFVKGGLNFTLRKPGYITAILGTFYRYNDDQDPRETMFDLYKVERNNGVISTLVRINNIYEDNGNIVYNVTGSNQSGKKLLFDFDSLTQNNVLKHAAAYYFEIPVLDGDYVIGCSKGSTTNNAYLMYLDIGANASDDTTEKPTLKYNIDSVDFVNSTTVVVSSDGKYQSYADIVAAISNLQDATQGVVIVFKRDGTTTTYSGTKVTDKLLYYYDGTLVTVEFVVSDGTGVVRKTTADEVLNP